MATGSDARPTFAAECAAVYVGGAVGALSRYGLVEAVGGRLTATFIANVVGCAVLGFVIAHRQNGWGSDLRLSLIGTGFCGGLTTFSTFQFEIWDLVDEHLYAAAAGYAAISIAAGVFAVSGARRFVDRGKGLA